MPLRRYVRHAVVAGAIALTTTAFGGVPAHAASTECVGLVVDATSLTHDVDATGCVTVPRGADGIDVLRAAHHSLTFRSDGLLCAIDGLPASGCAAVDDTHFWAYYHRAPGATGWTYSSLGPASYLPAGCSTEGWVYENGSRRTPSTTVTPCLAATRTAAPTASRTPHHRSLTTTTRTAHPAETARATPSVPASSTAARHERASSDSATAAPAGSTSAPSPDPPPTGTPVHASSSPGGGGGRAIGLGVAVVIVAALGAGAAARFRRGHGT